MIGSAPDTGYRDQVRDDVLHLVAPGARLLDLGGGHGRTAAELKRHGICQFAALIDLAAPQAGDGLDASLRGDLNTPGLVEQFAAEHGPFDTVLCLDSLEHLIAPERTLAEAFAALKPGGQLVASIPNVRHCSVLIPLLFKGRWDYAETGVLDRTHLRFFTRQSASALIEGAGFRIERVQPSATATRWQRLANLLTLGLLRDLFTMQYFFAARRPGP